ncbi:MAG TPA: SCP2 sterol-binding domain-containing protein [Steroidobacteraceae bacterium]|nr:SCP2 sterol-binding domain-containing protein [Steroidobacteraceae bacterium]
MLTATLGNLLNRGLPRSVRARQLVAELAGRSLAIEIRDCARLHVASDGLTLAVSRDRSAAADATLSGGPLSLLALGGAAAQAVLQRGDVVITGDTEVAGKFRELLALLRPDPEEELSLVIGDVPAHQLGRLALLAGGWGRRAARVTLANLADYLGHERRDLVPRNEGEQFLRGVEALREDADRLQARLELLERRRGAS